MAAKPPATESPLAKPGALVDLGLTLPVFLLYHAGVVFLGVRNGSDIVTAALLRAADGDVRTYLWLTAAIGVTFVGAFAAVGRGEVFAPKKFVAILVEAAVYAIAMKAAVGYAVGRLFAGHVATGREAAVGLVMSLGAGFYEELAYRVLLFGLGAKALGFFKLGLDRSRAGIQHGRDLGRHLQPDGQQHEKDRTNANPEGGISEYAVHPGSPFRTSSAQR